MACGLLVNRQPSVQLLIPDYSCGLDNIGEG